MSALDMLRRFHAIVEAGKMKPGICHNLAISGFEAPSFTVIYRLEQEAPFVGTLGFSNINEPYLDLAASDGRNSASITSQDLGKIVFERDLTDEQRAAVVAHFIKARGND